MNRFKIMEKFYSSKTLLKMAGGVGAYAGYPKSPLCFKLKIPKAVIKHDCCKEVKGMLSGGTGETIFKCWRFSSFLSYST